MALADLELFDSQESTVSRTGATEERKYLVYGDEDSALVKQFVADNLPPTISGVYGAVLGWVDFKVSHVGGGVHEVVARYSSQASERSFEAGGGTTRITQSRKTVARYGRPGATPPDFKGAINVTDDNIEGVDVGVSSFAFVEKHYLGRDVVDTDYEDNLSLLMERTNDAPFRHYGIGEVFLKQVSGQQRGIEDVELTFRFEVSRDEGGIRVGDIGLEWVDKDDIDDPFAEDAEVYRTPGGKAAPTPGSTNNRLLDVSHEASVPGDTDIGAGGDLTKLLPADAFTMGVSVYLDPDGKAVLTIGGGVNVFVGLAQSDSLAGAETVAIGLTLTKADADQAFDVETPLWVRNDGTADNRSTYEANEFIGKAYAASAVGATQVRVMTIFKGGWDYLWIRYLTDKDENHFVKTPVSVNIEKVYLSGDFSKLGIGTGPR